MMQPTSVLPSFAALTRFHGPIPIYRAPEQGGLAQWWSDNRPMAVAAGMIGLILSMALVTGMRGGAGRRSHAPRLVRRYVEWFARVVIGSDHGRGGGDQLWRPIR
jgi:hypothetical protein